MKKSNYQLIYENMIAAAVRERNLTAGRIEVEGEGEVAHYDD